MALLAVGVVLVTAGCSRGAPGAFAVARSRPVAYRVLYRVDQPSAKPTSVRWEELTVRRPFTARKAAFPQRPAGQRPDGGTLATVDRLYAIQSGGAMQEAAGRQPGPPTGDQALGPELAAAVARRLARPAGTGVVAGRRCREYRFLEPPVGPIKRLAGRDHDLVCIDEAGLVLREAWTLHGRLVLHRQAVRVVVDPPAVDHELDPAGAAPSPNPAAVPSAEPASGDGSVIAAPAPPAGFAGAAVDRFVLPGPQQQPGEPPPVLYTSTVWAFARGPDAVTVEVGSTPSGNLPWNDADASEPVALPIGSARSVLRNDGPELRVDLGGGRWLRVRGTVPPGQLEAYARASLHLRST